MKRVVVLLLLLCAVPSSYGQNRTAAEPGTRVLLDAHNAYPYNGQFADRTPRALATGVPVSIEQDLVWRPGNGTLPARSIVSHGEPFDDREPSLREYFFERIRPIVERALKSDDRSQWPLVILNLDLKTNESEHHRALWNLLGEYEPWLTTAPRTADGTRPASLDVKPVLVLTGESNAQAVAFHDQVAVGAKLRLFGAIALGAPTGKDPEAAAKFWAALPSMALPKATNYRRWWNVSWAFVEAGGQSKAGDWTAADDERLRTLVKNAHAANLWIRLWTVNGHPAGDEKREGWTTSYNVGSIEAARVRWRAAAAAGADFIASDQYEALAAVLRPGR